MHFHRHWDSTDDDDFGKLGFIAFTENQSVYYIEYNENNKPANPFERIRRIHFSAPLWYDSFVGSCNGLVCLARGPSVCICNPITREYAILPEIKRDWQDLIECYNDGTTNFGYVSSTGDYKVVVIYVSTKTEELVQVHIYTLGSGTGWKNLGKFNSPLSAYGNDRVGYFANGALYWIGTQSDIIPTFDVAEEKFCEHLSPPILAPDGGWMCYELGVFDGFLYCAYDTEDGRFNNIWILKRKNDNHEMKEGAEHQLFGWSKTFSVVDEKLLASTKSYGILTYVANYLNSYDTEASTLKKLMDFKEMFRTVLPHKNTLVSLKELGEEDAKSMEAVEGH